MDRKVSISATEREWKERGRDSGDCGVYQM
jgi:hypothetical protein